MRTEVRPTFPILRCDTEGPFVRDANEDDRQRDIKSPSTVYYTHRILMFGLQILLSSLKYIGHFKVHTYIIWYILALKLCAGFGPNNLQLQTVRKSCPLRYHCESTRVSNSRDFLFDHLYFNCMLKRVSNKLQA